MEFLKWLLMRLQYKHKENNDIILTFKNILQNSIIISNKIDPKYIDTICAKHFIDFNMEKCDDLSFGYTEEERSKLRSFALDIINGLIHK
jgi:hypothetical protein